MRQGSRIDATQDALAWIPSLRRGKERKIFLTGIMHGWRTSDIQEGRRWRDSIAFAFVFEYRYTRRYDDTTMCGTDSFGTEHWSLAERREEKRNTIECVCVCVMIRESMRE